MKFLLLSDRMLKRFGHHLLGFSEKVDKFFPMLGDDLKQSELGIEKTDYLSYCFASTLFYFILIAGFLAFGFYFSGHHQFIWVALVVAFLIVLLNLFRFIYYPSLVRNHRIRRIEQDLLIVMRNMYVQVNSDIPLFTVMVNISTQDFGEVSKEFKLIIRKVSSGVSEVKALEESATITPSPYFRTVLWQLINGIKQGSDISIVLKDMISMLAAEQIDQIQEYGASLSSLSMFYMLTVIILPSLAITFIIATAIFFGEFSVNFMFWFLYSLVILFQIVFLGLIKSKRPSLLRMEDV